ncbi:xanthine dehydrogenase-like protein [Hyaloscypha variabilis F]|uniref:xanthine dehydrogenase n=1 Tax=Hyaloscypha variabilis (strain UAMH 11265 / GT02V1 / F) TaxID=1149755 RepID=A0A2J6QVI2_HYAVF|nr:xanthine dehydrogenase-like protein [Hyaloscypha variabilis F]
METMELNPSIATVFKKTPLEFYLNGTRIQLSDPNPQWTLLDFIRSQHGLKGTKLGCGEGGCGACTVVIQTLDTHRERRGRVKHLAVNACLFPLIGAVGKHVITVEGIGNSENPHPLQERMAKLHGSQCGFCTPGIVMSLYALIRNSYDPVIKEFRLDESDIELEGHLDGNLCRCTGYKPILQAAKTFITEDLKGTIAVGENLKECTSSESSELSYTFDGPAKNNFSCGRPGGCCRDPPKTTDGRSPSDETSSTKLSEHSSDPGSHERSSTSESAISTPDDVEISSTSYGKPIKSNETNSSDGLAVEGTKTTTQIDTPASKIEHGIPQYDFACYSPGTELIFPAALRKFEQAPLFYGNSTHVWLRPVTLEQLLIIKDAYPSAKLVGGASEVQVEIRFKNSSFPISAYISDIEQLREIEALGKDQNMDAIGEVILGANASLTEVEAICKDLSGRLGQRGSVLEAMRKQLRYFAGRQIRNVASLAGNIATASPISDINPVLLTCGASLRAQSKARGKFKLEMSTFFTGYRTTTLPADAVITHIHIPLPPTEAREITKAYKQSKRKDDDIAIVTAAFRVRLNEDGQISEISLAYGGMAPRTVEAKSTTKSLIGKEWNSSTTLGAGMTSLAQEFDLNFEVPGGMATYRKTLAMSLFFRFWHEVISDLKLGEVDPDLINEIHRGISFGSRDNHNPHEQRVVGKQIPHLSALKQNTGEAQYVDDIPPQDRELYGAMVLSSRAHAKLIEVDWSPALGPGLAMGYVDKHSIPKEANLWGSIVKDEPFFADDIVLSHGQPIGLVYAETALQAQAAARAVKVVYEDLPAILTIDEAIKADSFFKHGKMLKKGAAIEGEMDAVWEKCDRVFEGTTRIGGQEHFYLETNAALVIPNLEDKTFEVWSSTQNTMETQEFVSKVTGVPSHRVNARVKRMGGAFGGKESRSVQLACLLAVASKKEGRPMRCMLNRDEDMMTTGQRHPIQARWKVGTTSDGKLIALEADLYDNAGFSQDMSGAVMDRCCTHLDNCYEIPNVLIRGHVCRTNTHSNTAFRGFGGPQAMFITESYMTAVAEGLGIPIDELRLRNLYKEGQLTPFLQTIDQDWHVPLLLSQISQETNYEARLASIQQFNSQHKWRKRGISMIPTKFGLSFATALHLNQAGASVKIYADGSILLHHGGTEMGQGLYTKMAQLAAQELNVPLSAIFTPDSTTYQIANASPTAASSGSDLNGMAIKDACDQLNERLAPFRAKFGPNADMKTLAHAAYLERVNLSANGFWKMPRIGYKWGNYDISTQKPMYYYFTQGVAVSEVELDVLTGSHTVLRTDIKMDIGRSINPAIDYGQIEGAFVQGLGLFTMEESLWTRDGKLATMGPGTYKIPGFSDIPQEFNVIFLQGVEWGHLRSVQSSKGVGEPPLFLGASVFFALRMAVLSARMDNGVEEPLVLDSPATPERLRLSVGDEILRKGTVVPKEAETNFFVSVA